VCKEGFPPWEAYIIYYIQRGVTSSLTHSGVVSISYTANHNNAGLISVGCGKELDCCDAHCSGRR
jgi:hypothetical protein